MKNLEIQGQKDVFFIPTVNFNAQTGKLKIKGESYLEDTRAFYLPMIQWVEEFIKNNKSPLTLDVDLSYYNTSTSKHILEILYVLKDYENEGGKVTVNWHYTEEDVDIEDDIEDFEIESGLKINLVSKDD